MAVQMLRLRSGDGDSGIGSGRNWKRAIQSICIDEREQQSGRGSEVSACG